MDHTHPKEKGATHEIGGSRILTRGLSLEGTQIGLGLMKEF